MLKRILAIVLCIAMTLGCLGLSASAATPVLQTEVETVLAKLVEEYNEGVYTDNFHGATQCKGFADMIYDALFDVGSIGYYPADIYYLHLNGAHTEEIGRVEPEYILNAEGVAAVKGLLSQALPGDYIQMKRPAGYGHSVIVLETDDEGIRVLHANWYGSNLISVDYFTWEQLAVLSDGISLYHYKNYLAAGEYVDVAKNAWYRPYVKYVSQLGLMNGTGHGIFSPDTKMTRAMVVTVLYRMSKDTGTYAVDFADVPQGVFYTAAVGWAQTHGIALGYSDGRFCPDETITRAQTALFLYRFARYQGYETTATASLSKFDDAAQIPSYARGALQWAAGEKIFQGSGGMLRPNDSATRAEMAKVLAVYHQLLTASEEPAAAYTAVPAAQPVMTGDLAQDLALALHSLDGVWSVYVKDLTTGQIICLNEAPLPAGDWIDCYSDTADYPMTIFAGEAGGPDVALTSVQDFGRLLERGCAATTLCNETNGAWMVPGQYVLCVMSDGAADPTAAMAQIYDLVNGALGE